MTRDDPKLMNLPMIISSERLELEGDVCNAPKLTEEQRPVAALLQESYESSAADLGVDAAVERASVLRISCGTGKFGPKIGSGWWLLVIDPNTIAVNWYDDGLLILRRG